MTDGSTDPLGEDDSLEGHTELRIAFCGGGSGGHLTPAIALARSWVRHHPNIRFHFQFICSGRQIDQTILSNAQLEDCDVDIVPQEATTSSRKLPLLNTLRKDFLAARRRFKQQPPDIVVGTGGFASVAAVLAARWLRHFPMLWEMNAVPGRATRWLSRLGLITHQGWPLTEVAAKKRRKLTVPMGIAIESTVRQFTGSVSSKNTLLIAGGSLGAARMNDLACDAVADNRRLLTGWKIIHQTGPHWQPTANQLESCVDLNWNRQAFIPGLAQQFRQANIVISRAGAVTLAEIASAEVASILLPLSSAADDHQTANAKLFEAAEAAFIVQESKASASAELTNHLKELIGNERKRNRMSSRCQPLQEHIITDRESTGVLKRLLHCSKSGLPQQQSAKH